MVVATAVGVEAMDLVDLADLERGSMMVDRGGRPVGLVGRRRMGCLRVGTMDTMVGRRTTAEEVVVASLASKAGANDGR